MAAPNKANQFNGKLRHMHLTTISYNPFNLTKQEGLVLTTYPQSTTPAVSIATQKGQWLGASILNIMAWLTDIIKKKKSVKSNIEYEYKSNQYIIICIRDIPS
jgi:hypothetical protein